jgi:large subunit ribosomal protein L21
MFAIVELGGKQYTVHQKDVLRVEKIDAEEGSSFKADKVLLKSDGKTSQIGTPYLPNTFVELKILKSGLNDKVITFKMKAKKRYKRTKNWRQPFTEVEVVKI